MLQINKILIMNRIYKIYLLLTLNRTKNWNPLIAS